MKTYYKYLILTILFEIIISKTLFSQNNELYYKDAFNQGFTIRPSVYYNVYGMKIENSVDTISYATNVPLEVGISVSHPKIPIGISVGYSIKATLNKKQVKTKLFNIQAHTYGKKYVFDAFFQRYKGFYIEDFDISTNNINCSDLSVISIGLIAQYIFNNKKFSYSAAYSQNEVQLKSAGTFLMGGGIYFFYVKSPNFPIYETQNKIRNFQIGLNGGYAYNWVINKFLINASLSAGANVGNGNLGTPTYKKLFLKPTALARISMFYNAERWSLGVLGVYNLGLPIYTTDVKMQLHSGKFSIVYLYRFKKIKIRRRRKQNNL